MYLPPNIKLKEKPYSYIYIYLASDVETITEQISSPTSPPHLLPFSMTIGESAGFQPLLHTNILP